MNEVEKMYSNAGVKPYKSCYNCFDNNGKIIKDSKDCPSRKSCCNTCDTPEYNFTAEKQLEITKFIGLHYGFQMLKNEAFDYIITTKIFVKYELEYKGYGYGYDEAIANLVNDLWQDLTEEERKQIKEILE